MLIDDDDDMAPSEAIYCLSSMHKTQECVCFFLGGGRIYHNFKGYKYL